jgi:hypothetical protein
MADIDVASLRAWARDQEPQLAGLRDDAPVYIQIGDPNQKVRSEVRTAADDRDIVLDLDESGRICGIEIV